LLVYSPHVSIKPLAIDASLMSILLWNVIVQSYKASEQSIFNRGKLRPSIYSTPLLQYAMPRLPLPSLRACPDG